MLKAVSFVHNCFSEGCHVGELVTTVAIEREKVGVNKKVLVHDLICIVLIIGKVSEKRDLACIIKKHNKNALRLKCYNFRRVNAIVFLFSALHITPFLYGKILFGILHLLLASIATFDTPPGSNPP